MARVKKTVAITVIVFALWMQVSSNLQQAAILLESEKPDVSGPKHSPGIWHRFTESLRPISQGLNRVGWTFGLKPYWGMFSPMGRTIWWLEISAVHPEGNTTLLPLPLQSPRTWWQRNFFDYREQKYIASILDLPSEQRHYAEYLCRHYRNSDPPVSAIQINKYWQNILSPRQARIYGRYLGDVGKDLSKEVIYKCANSSDT